MAWQKSNGLDDDGICGPLSLEKSGIKVGQRQQNASAQGTKRPSPVAENPGDIVINTAAYSQGDPDWKHDKPGNRTIGSIGCAMTSSTMALNGITGKNRTPKEVNAHLSANDGYYGNLLIRDKIASYYACSTDAPSPGKKTISDQLKAGNPSAITVKNGGHRVCVVGVKADGTFTIIDSAGGKTLTGTWNGETISVKGYATGKRQQTFT